MSAKHRTPEYHRNARIIRDRVRAAWRSHRHVACWRCGRALIPNGPFDVGHLPGARASALHELAPEHRHRTDTCEGNRAAGGAVGAAKTNARHRPNQPTESVRTWKM